MNLKEIVCKGVEWINLALDRFQLRDLVITVLNLRLQNLLTS
jgi:hypothetical protein